MPYSHFPHVLSPLCIYSYTLNSMNCTDKCNIVPHLLFPMLYYQAFCIYTSVFTLTDFENYLLYYQT